MNEFLPIAHILSIHASMQVSDIFIFTFIKLINFVF